MGLKRGAGKLFLVMIMAIIITGCSSNNDVSTTESDPNRASNEGGTLVIARLSDAENLDQQFMSTINAASVTHHKIYEGLVQRDENSEIQPMLAENWKQINDTTWEFKLREDVKFHDGTPFNADAVKKTFDRLLDPVVASPRAVVFDMVKEVKPVDEFTVQFILKEPFSLSFPYWRITKAESSVRKRLKSMAKRLSRNRMEPVRSLLIHGPQARKSH